MRNISLAIVETVTVALIASMMATSAVKGPEIEGKRANMLFSLDIPRRERLRGEGLSGRKRLGRGSISGNGRRVLEMFQ